MIENSLNADETLDKAHEMFAKPGEYERILNLKGKAAATAKKN